MYLTLMHRHRMKLTAWITSGDRMGMGIKCVGMDAICTKHETRAKL